MIRLPTAFFITSLLCLAVIASPSQPLRNTSTSVAKKFKTVKGRKMAYVELGSGDPTVFLHGVNNGDPASSYAWRNVMPHVGGLGRLIAPDLIGMGDSDKLPAGDPSSYSFAQQSNYLFELLEVLEVKENVTLVVHDWGGPLGFLWAYYHRFNPNSVKGNLYGLSLGR